MSEQAETREACPHMNFNSHANVGRISKSDGEPDVIVAYTVDFRITCRDCEQPFEFFGLPNGFSYYRPTVSIDGQEMRVPLVIPGTEPPAGMAGFSVTHEVFDEGKAVIQ